MRAVPVPLRASPCGGGGCSLFRQVFAHFQLVAGDAGEFVRCGEQAHFADALVDEDLCADAVGAQVLFLRAFRWRVVVREGDHAADDVVVALRVVQHDDDAVRFLREALQRFLQGVGALAEARVEEVAEGVLYVDADEGRARRLDVAFCERVVQAVFVIDALVGGEGVVAVGSRQFALGDADAALFSG